LKKDLQLAWSAGISVCISFLNQQTINAKRSASVTETAGKGRGYFRRDLGNDDKAKPETHSLDTRDSAETFKKICEEAWAPEVPTPIPSLGLPIQSSMASRNDVPNRSGSITYRVTFSFKADEKRHHQGFDKIQKAEQFEKLMREKATVGKQAGGGFDTRAREKYYPGRAVAGRTFDPHYRSETVEEIPPSSEGVAFKPATWCLLGRVYRTKDIGRQHAHPRVK